jgi:hypothetical protein
VRYASRMLEFPDIVDPRLIARILRVPRRDLATRLGVTSNWVRQLARDPRHSRRILVAVLEVAADRLRAENQHK